MNFVSCFLIFGNLVLFGVLLYPKPPMLELESSELELSGSTELANDNGLRFPCLLIWLPPILSLASW